MSKPDNTIPSQRIYLVLGLALLAGAVIYLLLRGALAAGATLAVGGILAAVLTTRASSHSASQNATAGTTKKPKGSLSQVTTDYLEGEVDALSDLLHGTIRKGMFEGHQIGTLRPAELALLWQDCRADDPEASRLLENHLDALYPNWRDDVRRGEAHLASGPDGRMSMAEAYKILGLSEGASHDQIRHAHRDLMLKLHPDKGGSTYLSSKINEAKDVLISRG